MQNLRMCVNCAFFCYASFGGKVVTTQSRCTHQAFYRTGFVKVDRKDYTYEIISWMKKDRPSKELMLEHFSKQEFFSDLLGTATITRTCPHWISNRKWVGNETLTHISLSLFGSEILVKYLYENIESLNKNHPFREFIEKGFPKEVVEYPPVKEFHQINTDCIVVPDKYCSEDNCCTCVFYKPIINRYGFTVPHIGECTRLKSNIFSQFSLLDDGKKYTFSGATCGYYSQHKMFRKVELISVPERAFIYLEPHPMNLLYDDLYLMASYPILMIRNHLTDEEHHKIQTIDLREYNKTLIHKDSFKSCEDKYGIGDVRKSFISSLKKSNQEHKDFWSQFEHLKF